MCIRDSHKISTEEAYEMMASQEVVVVDVRTQEEYDGGHIAVSYTHLFSDSSIMRTTRS